MKCSKRKTNYYFSTLKWKPLQYDYLCYFHYSASGGDIIETAIELAPLDHDTSHSRKRVSGFSITLWSCLDYNNKY